MTMKQSLILLLLTLFEIGFGQTVWTAPVRMWRYGVLGFIYLVLAFLLFSIIFWGVYLWLVKGKEKKDKTP